MFRSRSVVCAFVAAAALPTVDAHGYLRDPPARNVVDPAGNAHCPHCGNGGSKAHAGSVCGDGNQWPSDDYYVKQVQAPQIQYHSGQVVKFDVSLNVNHMGHHEFFVCDRPVLSNVGAVECFQRWPLMRATPEELGLTCEIDDEREDCQPVDPNFPGRWYHIPGMSEHKISYRIPDELSCSECTLLWFWPTANSRAYDEVSYSCYQQRLTKLGWNRFNFCGWACADSLCPDPDSYMPSATALKSPDPEAGLAVEEFRNCADIAIIARPGDDDSGTSSSTTPEAEVSTTTTTTAAPETTVQTTTAAPETTVAPTGGKKCKATPGLNRGVSDSDCKSCEGDYQWWPCNEEILCECTGSSSEDSHEPETPVPHPADPVSETNTGKSCVANLNLNRGVYDSDCKRCETGYKWWPCNEAELCICSGSGEVLVEVKRLRQPSSKLATARLHAPPVLLQEYISSARVEPNDEHARTEL